MLNVFITESAPDGLPRVIHYEVNCQTGYGTIVDIAEAETEKRAKSYLRRKAAKSGITGIKSFENLEKARETLNLKPAARLPNPFDRDFTR